MFLVLLLLLLLGHVTTRKIQILFTKWSNQKFVLKVAYLFFLRDVQKLSITHININTDESNDNTAEGSPNWELFAPTGNRFFLPGSMGPAWQGASTSASAADMDIENLIDFDAVKFITIIINN